MYHTDVDECLVDNGNCSDTCVNDIPYHHCECDDGDELDPSGLTCIHNVECSGDGSNFTCSCLPGYEDTTTNNSYNCTGKPVTSACNVTWHVQCAHRCGRMHGKPLSSS